MGESWKRVVVSTPVALAAVLLAGCGAQEAGRGPGTTVSDPPVERAASADELMADLLAAMAEQGTVHISIGNQNPPPVLEVNLELAGGADADMVAVLALGFGTEATEVRRTDGMVYLDPMGLGFGSMSTTDPRLTEDDGFNAGAMGRVARLDLVRELEGIAEADTGFAALGTDSGAGDPAQHYVVTADTRAWLATQTQVPRTLGSRFPKELKMHLWVDEAGLPVRWEYDYPNLLQPGEQSTARTDFTGWGEPVEVEVPDEIEELPQ